MCEDKSVCLHIMTIVNSLTYKVTHEKRVFDGSKLARQAEHD